MIWLLVAGLAAAGLLVWWKHAQSAVFTHEGAAYRRRPDGSFVDAGGTVVAGGSATAMSLAAAYEVRRQHERDGRNGGSGSDGSGASGSDGCSASGEAGGGSCSGDGGGD